MKATPQAERPSTQEYRTKMWENFRLVTLGLTIFGQVTVGPMFLLGQGVWLISNIISLVRDFMLQRPYADKITDAVMTAITAGLIIAFLLL